MIITRNNKLGGPSMALPDYLYDFDKMDKIPIRVWGIIYLKLLDWLKWPVTRLVRGKT